MESGERSLPVDEQTFDVVVVGAGPAGLTAAAELGRYGLRTLVLERRRDINPHPRARSINVRTGEIFRRYGILDELESVSLPLPWTTQFVYTDCLAGREIGRVATSVQPETDGIRLSPVPWLLSSQDQIEPVLARYAAGHPTVEIRWGCEVESVDPTAEGASIRYRERPSGDSTESLDARVTARWVVAADGAASPIRRQLGIEMEGAHDLATLINCQFWADLDPWTADRPAALYWTTAPARNVFQKIDQEHRWLCQLGYDPREQRAEDFSVEFVTDWIRRSIGDDNIAIDVTHIIPWTMSSTVAEHFRIGPVFLIGDAAHQLPPSGGFGMNTGVQDAHNLAWKLAYVARGWASPELLDTYHQERHPVARCNADRSLENTRAVGRIRRVAEQGGDGSMSESEAIEASGRYGSWLGMDLGLAYEHGAVIDDGTPPPTVVDPVKDYAPCARPGHRAPWIVFADGTDTLSRFDAVFTLVTADRAWDIGPRPAFVTALIDAELADRYDLGPRGACLVRPDGHVAWRTIDQATTGVLHEILIRLHLNI